MAIVRNQCSGCMESFTLNTTTLVVTMTVPSNGKRGALHVAEHKVTADAADMGDLIEWECPRCGYSESEYADAEARAEAGH